MYVYCVTVLSLILSFDFCRPRSPFERSRAKKEEKKRLRGVFLVLRALSLIFVVLYR